MVVLSVWFKHVGFDNPLELRRAEFGSKNNRKMDGWKMLKTKTNKQKINCYQGNKMKLQTSFNGNDMMLKTNTRK